MAEQLRRNFARKLKSLRISKGLSQLDLAKKLDIHVRYVQQLEGTKVPNVKLDTIAKLALALKVPAFELLKF
jgi:transcriptional regulator with XRE-family HTH domain